MTEHKQHSAINQAIAAFKAGRPVIILDDEGRENEGDLALPADAVTPSTINFMATYARGLICVAIGGQRLDTLDLPQMVDRNTASHATAFTISVDAAEGISTGISAHDRAHTIKVLLDPDSRPSDLARPGHIFPLRYEEGGVLARAGQTEGSVDLARLAGRSPSAVICEIMAKDGTMARKPELEKFSTCHSVPIVTVADIIAYRFQHDRLVERVAETALPTRSGSFNAVAYRSLIDSAEHIALVKGNIDDSHQVLVRVHSECLTGDVFGSLRCDCGDQASMALTAIEQEGRGIFLYMRQEGRGIGLHNKIKAYELQDRGFDTVEANEKLGFAMDLRRYGIAAQILLDQGVRHFRLLTNNPRKVVGLEGFGLNMVERIPIIAPARDENARYMSTKLEKMGHLLEIADRL